MTDVRWIGTSMGGTLGALAAGPMSDRITHHVLNDVGPAPGADEEAQEGIDRIIDYLTNPPSYPQLTGLEAFYRESYATFSEMSDEEWRRFTVTSARRLEDGQFTPAYDPRVVEPLLTEEHETDPWIMWENIDVPTYVLKGERSDILADDTFAKMQDHCPEIDTQIVDSGHAPALNIDEQINPIRKFLAT